jgi:hypothetical protein
MLEVRVRSNSFSSLSLSLSLSLEAGIKVSLQSPSRERKRKKVPSFGFALDSISSFFPLLFSYNILQLPTRSTRRRSTPSWARPEQEKPGQRRRGRATEMRIDQRPTPTRRDLDLGLYLLIFRLPPLLLLGFLPSHRPSSGTRPTRTEVRAGPRPRASGPEQSPSSNRGGTQGGPLSSSQD